MKSVFITAAAAVLAFTGAFLAARARTAPAPRDAQGLSADAIPSQTGQTLRTGSSDGDSRAAFVLNDPLLQRALANPDLAAAVRDIMEHYTQDYAGAARLACLVECLPAERLMELPGALEKFLRLETELPALLGAWAKRDPAAAMKWAQTWHDSAPAFYRDSISTALGGWARVDSDAALAWLEQQPLSAHTPFLRCALVESLSERDPSAAFELMKSRGWFGEAPLAVVKLFGNWGGADPPGALQGLRDALAHMGLDLAKDSAASWKAGGVTTNTLLSALLQGALARDPRHVIDLLENLTRDEMNQAAEPLSRWVLPRIDESLASWIKTLQTDNAAGGAEK